MSSRFERLGLTEDQIRFKADREGGMHIKKPEIRVQDSFTMRDWLLNAYNLSGARMFRIRYRNGDGLYYRDNHDTDSDGFIISLDWRDNNEAKNTEVINRYEDNPYYGIITGAPKVFLNAHFTADNPGWDRDYPDFIDTVKAGEGFSKVFDKISSRTKIKKPLEYDMGNIKDEFEKSSSNQGSEAALNMCGDYLSGVIYNAFNVSSETPDIFEVLYKDGFYLSIGRANSLYGEYHIGMNWKNGYYDHERVASFRKRKAEVLSYGYGNIKDEEKYDYVIESATNDPNGWMVSRYVEGRRAFDLFDQVLRDQLQSHGLSKSEIKAIGS